MEKRAPDFASSTFLLLEGVRQEVGNKVSLVGVFLNNDLIVPQGAGENAVLEALGFVFIARGGNGEFDVRFDIVGPDDRQVVSAPMSKAVLEYPKVHFTNARIEKFPAKIGKYKVVFYYDKLSCQHEFEIKHSE
jgi:hypothetical protein